MFDRGEILFKFLPTKGIRESLLIKMDLFLRCVTVLERRSSSISALVGRILFLISPCSVGFLVQSNAISTQG